MSSDIQRQKDSHSRGFARIWIRHLQFETETNAEKAILRSGQDDERRLKYLLRNSREDECHRCERMYVLPVVMDGETLGRALDSAQGSPSSMLPRLVHDAPLLALPDDALITCRDGRLRVCVARQFFPISDQWWTVEVYDDVDEQARGRIEARILKCRRITTLHSFAEDTVLLEICYKVLSDLLPCQWAGRHTTWGRTGRTLREMFRASFTLEIDLFPAHYLSLWLDAIRNFTDLSNLRSAHVRKDRLKPTPPARAADASKMAQLALRASRRGFKTDAITRWADRCPRGSDLEAADPQPPRFVTDKVYLPPRYRCGRPREAEFLHSRESLYLSNVLEAPYAAPGEHVTWLAVACEIISTSFQQDVLACSTQYLRQGKPAFLSGVDLETEVLIPSASSCGVRPDFVDGELERIGPIPPASSVYTTTHDDETTSNGDQHDEHGRPPGRDSTISRLRRYTSLTGPNDPFASSLLSHEGSPGESVVVDLHKSLAVDLDQIRYAWEGSNDIRTEKGLPQLRFLYCAVPFKQLNINPRGEDFGNILAYTDDRESDFEQDVDGIRTALCATSLPLDYFCPRKAPDQSYESRVVLFQDAWRSLVSVPVEHGAVIVININPASLGLASH
ncbi:hypothetical protein LTR86_010396 [Recurvomyces mirabilis]|nr:hypothetical protein LTR86_010396 [Recurvomyces mirabilis]